MGKKTLKRETFSYSTSVEPEIQAAVHSPLFHSTETAIIYCTSYSISVVILETIPALQKLC